MIKPVNGYIEKLDLTTQPKHELLERGADMVSSPLWTKDEILHASQIEERDFNELDQNTLKRNIFKKKSNRSLNTENRNSLYSSIEENGHLKYDTKEKEELFTPSSTDHNIKNSNRNSGSFKTNLHNTNPTYMALGHALSKTKMDGEYCYPQDPLYHILDGQDPNAAPSPHLYDVLEGQH